MVGRGSEAERVTDAEHDERDQGCDAGHEDEHGSDAGHVVVAAGGSGQEDEAGGHGVSF